MASLDPPLQGGLELGSGVVEPFHLSFWGGAHGCHPFLQALSAWEEVTWLNIAASVSPHEVEGTGDMKARLALAMKPNSTACRAVDVFGKMPRDLWPFSCCSEAALYLAP